jgi:hypothetical protein
MKYEVASEWLTNRESKSGSALAIEFGTRANDRLEALNGFDALRPVHVSARHEAHRRIWRLPWRGDSRTIVPRDSRCKAGIDVDGSLHCSVIQAGIHKPFKWMSREVWRFRLLSPLSPRWELDTSDHFASHRSGLLACEKQPPELYILSTPWRTHDSCTGVDN